MHAGHAWHVSKSQQEHRTQRLNAMAPPLRVSIAASFGFGQPDGFRAGSVPPHTSGHWPATAPPMAPPALSACSGSTSPTDAQAQVADDVGIWAAASASAAEEATNNRASKNTLCAFPPSRLAIFQCFADSLQLLTPTEQASTC